MPVDITTERFERLCQYLELDPTNVSLREQAAEVGAGLGLLRQARELLEDGLRLAPDQPSLLFRLGSICLALRDYEGAILQLTALTLQGNSHPAVLYNLGYAFTQKGQLNDARNALAGVSSEQLREMPEASHLVAYLHHLDEKWARATEVLEAAIQCRPEDGEAWGQLALVQFDAGDSDKARLAGSRALALKPDQVYALIALGAIALEMRNGGDALDYFGRTIGQDPRNGRGWSGLAFAQLLSLNIDAAMDSFRQAVEFMPDHIGTWHGLAWVQILAGDLSGAKESFNRALAIDRNFADTHGGLAVVAAMEGRERDAELAARRGSGLSRNSYPTQYAKSLLLSRRGQGKEAQALINQLMEGAPIEGGPTAEALVAELVSNINARNRKKH